MRELVGQRRLLPAACVEGRDADLGVLRQQPDEFGAGVAGRADHGDGNGGAHRASMQLALHNHANPPPQASAGVLEARGDTGDAELE